MSYDSRPDTLGHIGKVQARLRQMTGNLEHRAKAHDASKLESPEKEGYDGLGESLKGLEYGTQEYRDNLKRHKPTIQEHYDNNDHHPEYYPNGIDGMSLMSVTEMLADWKAAGERTDKGDIRKSLEINRERFEMSDQLYNILKNTIDEMGW